MSTVNGFQVGSETLKYNYESLENYNTPNFSTSSSTTYAVGDYVMYNGKLYKCTTATTGGTWVSGSWAEAVLSDDVTDLNRQLSDLESTVSTTQIINSASGAIASFDDGADEQPIRKLVAQIEPVQDLHGYDSPWPAGGGVNKFDVGTQASDYHNTGIINSISGAIVTLNINGSGSTVTYRNQNLTITGQVNISWTASKSYSRAFVKLRKLDDSGWMTDSDASITGMAYNTYYGGWYYGTVSASMNLSIEIPTCLYWNLGIGYGNNEAAEGTTETISYIMLVTGSSAPSAYAPYSNICPISGHTGAEVTRTGKNLLPSMSTDETTYGVTWHVNEDNSISVSGTATRNSVVDFGRGHLTLKPGTYTTNRAKDGVVCAIWENSSHAQLIDGAGGTFVLTQDTPIFIRFYVPSGSTVNTTIYPQLELGSTITDYEPYTGNQISVTFPSSAGTVYGGTLDVISGLLTVDRAMVDLTTGMSGGTAGSGYVFYKAISNPKIVPNSQIAPIISEAYIPIRFNGISSSINTIAIRDNGVLYVNTGSADIQPTGKAVYELVTPQTYQLTESEISGILSTLYGTNNIWTDVGTVDVEYSADTKLYIEQLTKPTEGDMTANDNIAANKFFMIGNTLYFSTAAIAAGATIIPGTNCNVISLADALNNLNS